MTDLEVFARCAAAFELSFLTNDWSHIRPFYADNCHHIVYSDGDHNVEAGGPLALDDKGGDAVVSGLKRSVDAMDRRFDIRIPEITDGPEVRPEGIWMRFRLRFRRAGLPELALEGWHLQAMRDGRIHDFREQLDAGHSARVNAYLKVHDKELKPASAPFEPSPNAADIEDLETAMRRNLVRIYAAAKSVQDIDAALAVCHPEFRLNAVSFGTESENCDDSRRHMQAFFSAFPDYRADVGSLVADSRDAACWGRVEMTNRGDFAGVAANGGKCDLPFFSAFSFRDGLIAGERFFVDLASLCEQAGLSIPAVQAGLKATRAALRRPGS